MSAVHGAGRDRCPSGPASETGWPERDDPWDDVYDSVAEREHRVFRRIDQDDTPRQEQFRKGEL